MDSVVALLARPPRLAHVIVNVRLVPPTPIGSRSRAQGRRRSTKTCQNRAIVDHILRALKNLYHDCGQNGKIVI